MGGPKLVSAVMKIVAAIVLIVAASASAPKKPTVQEINDRFVDNVMKSIAGHESEPAEKVFMDIRIESLKSVPAARFITIMDKSYARALGVTCTHCHVESDFSSDDKRPKRAARQMATMHRMINQQLREMKDLDDPPDQRAINCSTCHRGSNDPRETEDR